MHTVRLVVALILLIPALTQMASAEQGETPAHGPVVGKKVGITPQAPHMVHSVVLSPGNPSALMPHGPMRMPTRMPPRHE